MIVALNFSFQTAWIDVTFEKNNTNPQSKFICFLKNIKIIILPSYLNPRSDHCWNWINMNILTILDKPFDKTGGGFEQHSTLKSLPHSSHTSITSSQLHLFPIHRLKIINMALIYSIHLESTTWSKYLIIIKFVEPFAWKWYKCIISTTYVLWKIVSNIHSDVKKAVI